MLEIKGIKKTYGKTVAMDTFQATFHEGQVYSAVGPNGAGKTTLIRMIAGLLTPDSGEVLLNGMNTGKRECKQLIGYVPEFDMGYPKLTVGELVQMEIRLKYHGKWAEQAEELLHDFELSDKTGKLIEECSGGMKKKLELVMSLLGEPKLLLLDEPTNAVDTTGLLTLKRYILQAKERGTIILVTSHVLDFVSSIADNSLFLNKGVLVKTVGNDVNLEDTYRELFL